MEEEAVGRGDRALMRTLWVLAAFLGLTLRPADFLEVEMAQGTQKVFLNDNTTIVCKVPGSPYLDVKIMGITWFRKNQVSKEESKLFEFFGHHQKALRPGATVSLQRLKRGDASLQLPAVQLHEAGEYRCELVVTPEKAQGRVWLEVLASPVSNLSPEQAMVKSNEGKNISCRSSWFYPENISITWKKWTQKDPQYLEVSESIITGPTIKNSDGTFNVTSSLILKPSPEDGMIICQCEVRHISMVTSQRFNSTLTLTESEDTAPWKIIILLIVFVLVGWVRLCYCF